MNLSGMQFSGWAIIWPAKDGKPPSIELDYFHSPATGFWETHGDKVTPSEWMRRHRPQCQLKRITITIP